MRISLVIAAGGSGRRFKSSLKRAKPGRNTSSVSKLFQPLAGKPLLAHSLRAFQSLPEVREIWIASPKRDLGKIKKLVGELKLKKARVICGGKTRAQSVLNALKKTSRQNPWVMVHDGARPLVRPGLLRKLFKKAGRSDGAILAKKVVPTIKKVVKGSRIQATVDRSVLFEAETPQLVKRKLLVEAYRKGKQALQATDEASLLEGLGASVNVLAHGEWNPKITSADDLRLAEFYLRKDGKGEADPVKTGFGRDTHRLVSGRPLMIGGLRIPFHKGALGHSDGDALLHAITDAMLGCLGAGDIGDWFSDQDPKHQGIASWKILQKVYAYAKKQGWVLTHIDSVVTLEAPKLGAYKKKMKTKIAKELALGLDAVSIKAKTREGLGPEGRGQAITCEAIVTMKRKN